MRIAYVELFLAGILLCSVNIWALSKTNGTPLGGMGTGYVKFDARSGDFATSSRIPPAAGDMACEFPGKMSSSSGFHFFAGGESRKKAKTENEDAKCPLYTADFGKLKDVRFLLNAFGPFIPGDKELNYQLAASPLAFFEITAKNEGSSSIDVAVALEFKNGNLTVTGLLGGKSDAEIDPQSGNKGIYFPTNKFGDVTSYPNNEGNAYILVDCSKEDAIYSAGGLGDFFTTGVLSNTNGNCVAAKCNIGAGESVRFKFVMAWWRTFISGKDRYNVGKNDEDNFYYHNFYKNSKEAALFGMEHFDKVKEAVVSMVNRVMASNFPDWYKDRLLNNTYPLIHNSFWAKDGRAAFWEGGYGIIGTIDQGQHASIWYIYNWPKHQWLELQYWLRNMWRDPNVTYGIPLLGQIHHDFNIAEGTTFQTPESRFMAPWDHFDRPDYWWCPNTTDWSDLNSMTIFKAYELMVATGNIDSIKAHYNKLLLVAERLYKMSKEGGATIPKNSRSTYDSDHDFSFPQYNCGLAVATYKAMEEIANAVGDEENAKKYKELFEKAKKEYKELFFSPDFGTINNKNWAEGHVGGYSWADYFCFEPIMDSAFIYTGCKNIWNIYSQQSELREQIGGWHFYTYDHLGGSLIAIGYPDSAFKLHKIDYKLYYEDYPELVFWQTLFSKEIGPQKYSSYMTAPSVWRSYFQFMGYLLDNANHRLWIRPRLPKELNKKIVKAALPNPSGWGTLNYDETGDAEKKLVQEIEISYDNPVLVKEIVLKDNTGVDNPGVVIYNNGSRVEIAEIKKEKREIEKNIRVILASPIEIGPAGAKIGVYTSLEYGIISQNLNSRKGDFSIISSTISPGKPIRLILNQAGKFKLELLSMNGAKIGTLKEIKVEKAGEYSFVWDGKTVEGKRVAKTLGILRISSKRESIAKVVLTESKN